MKNNTIYIIIASIAVAVIGTAAFVLVSSHAPVQISPVTETKTQNNVTIQAPIQNVKKFNSTDEMQKFLLESQVQASAQYYGGHVHGGLEQLGRAQAGATAPVPPMAVGTPASQVKQGAATTNSGVQYSTTNVQVAGIDEPDFLKN